MKLTLAVEMFILVCMLALVTFEVRYPNHAHYLLDGFHIKKVP